MPDGWEGTCQVGDEDDLGGGPIGDGETTGDQEAAIDCDGDVYNNKVIGARYFVAGFGAPDPDEFLSPRDAGGHGSNTASTSGGNYDVPITVGGAELGSINGMAPRARIAAYKVCWQTPAGGILRLGGHHRRDRPGGRRRRRRDQLLDLGQHQQRRHAAGDRVPQRSSGWHLRRRLGRQLRCRPAPRQSRTTTRGSPRSPPARRTASSGPTRSSATATPTPARASRPACLRRQRSTAARPGSSGADSVQARLCQPDTLDPDEVDGRIVVCERGVTARGSTRRRWSPHSAASASCSRTTPANGTSTNTEFHVIPTVHVAYEHGQDDHRLRRS